MNYSKYFIFYGILCVQPFFLSFQTVKEKQKKKGTIVLIIEPCFNNKPLHLDGTVYVNAKGDSLCVDLFKFYLSHIKFRSDINPFFAEENSYHLVDAEDSVTQKITINNVPEGIYNGLEYSIGIDSLANVSGVLSGDLDPIKEMYWIWNTGYISAKLQGHSKVCKTLHNEFIFHIGGYLGSYNSFQTILLKTNDVNVHANEITHIVLSADVSEWFKTPEKIDIAKINNIVFPCKESVIIAGNYADMIKCKGWSIPDEIKAK
jgi:hypothetical protein